MNNVNSCGILIKRIHDSLQKEANNSLRSSDLTMVQLSTLFFLNELPERQSSMKEIERYLHIAQSTATGIVSRLEQKGFVETFGSADDKRIKMVRIAKSGTECCNTAQIYMEQAERNLLFGLTADEQKQFFSLLSKVSKTMQ